MQVILSSVITKRTWQTIYEEESARLARKGITGYASAFESFLKPLATFLDRGRAGPSKESVMTAAERKALGGRVKRACEDALRAVEPLSSAEFFEWRDAIRRAAEEMDIQDDELPLPAIALGYSEMSTAALKVLARASDLWQKPSRTAGPPVPRPGAAGAEMLFLLRTLAIGFMHRFGKPLPSPAQQMTGVFHEEALNMDTPGVLRRVKPVLPRV